MSIFPSHGDQCMFLLGPSLQKIKINYKEQESAKEADKYPGPYPASQQL